MKENCAKLAVPALALSTLLSSLGVSIANAALPVLANAFHASFTQAQWVVLAYLLAVTVVIVSAGRLGDLWGRRRVFLAGIVAFTGASLLCGLAPSLPFLIAARALQGVGGATSIALSLALVSDAVPRERIGAAMGLLGTMSAVGTALGPSLSGPLVALFGWRAIFLVLVPLGALSFALARRCVPFAAAAEAGERQPFDLRGALLLGLALALYAFGMTAEGGRLGGRNFALLFAAFVTGALFVHAERRAASPLVSLPMIDRALGASLAMNAIVSTVMMATLVIGPFYLSRGLGLGQAMVGLVMSVGPGMSILSGRPAGRLVDRYGARPLMLLGLGAMAAGAASLSVLPGLLGLAGYVASVAVLSPGYQLFLAANSSAVMSAAGRQQRGVVSGLLSLSRNLGLVTGASMMGAVFALAAHAPRITQAGPEAIATGMRATFAFAALLAVVALLIAARSRARPGNFTTGAVRPAS